ncbi:MAG: hypothetical protein ACTSUF_03425 [Candidatus Heimdallarchaeaceae archaeon]
MIGYGLLGGWLYRKTKNMHFAILMDIAGVLFASKLVWILFGGF